MIRHHEWMRLDSPVKRLVFDSVPFGPDSEQPRIVKIDLALFEDLLRQLDWVPSAPVTGED